jgi:hypothetical protein
MSGRLQDQPMVTANKCPSGKVGYLTQIGAKLALNQVRGRRKPKPGEGEWTEYFCRICRHWHLTSSREK